LTATLDPQPARVWRTIIGACLALTGTSLAARSGDFAGVLAKAAGATARTIPGAKAEINDGIALVSRHTIMAPNMDWQNRNIVRASGEVEVPQKHGVMFILRLRC
jgi:hypothetical protein